MTDPNFQTADYSRTTSSRTCGLKNSDQPCSNRRSRCAAPPPQTRPRSLSIKLTRGFEAERGAEKTYHVARGRRFRRRDRHWRALGRRRRWKYRRRCACRLIALPAIPPCSLSLRVQACADSFSESMKRTVHDQELFVIARAAHQPLGRRHPRGARPLRPSPSRLGLSSGIPVRPPRPDPPRRSLVPRRRERDRVAVPRRVGTDEL